MFRKNRLEILAAMGFFACANPANALVIGTGTPIAAPPGTPFTSPEAALGATWQSYQLSIASNSGEIITGWLADIQAPLHQRWTDPDSDDELDKSLNGPASNTRGDSHLTVLAGDLLFSADEDSNTAASPLSGSNTYSPGTFTGGTAWGVGAFLKGGNAIAVANQGTTANVALIVLPEDFLHSRVFMTIDVAGPGPSVIGTLRECDFFVCAPESPDIYVEGSDEEIVNGDSTPSITDDTDFGTVEQGSIQQRTYTIHNFGDGPLRLGLPSFTGDSQFSLIGDIPPVITESDSATFTVGFDTTEVGDFSGMISFMHNDYEGEDGPYHFAIAATVIPEPASLMLVGLAMFGLVGFTRRQSA